MPPNWRAQFKVYLKHLSRKTRQFPCTHCETLVSAKDYENHCSQQHGLNAKLFCVWCCGTYSWKTGEKNRHSTHLIDCFKKFNDSRQVRTLTRPRELDSTCPEVESFFDHSDSILQLLPSRAFQSIWTPEDLPTPPMTFQNETLNLAASYLQLYLETRDTHDWIHVMVKAITMESFLRALDQDNGDTRILEFWCWCDGGIDSEDMLRQHRHMIAVSAPPKDRFENQVWPLVAIDGPNPRPSFPCKRIKKITSPRHLVNTLGYLSKRQSKCNFTRTTPNARLRDNHFYFSRALPQDHKLPLVTLWPGGVEELLYQETFQRAIASRIVEKPLFRAPGSTQWRQKIKDFYELDRGLVIPVEKRFGPVTTVTPYYVHLTRSRKLYFEPSMVNENLNKASWLQMQFEGGNAFYDAVEDETWTPRPREQSRINDIMPLIEKIGTLEAENEELKRQFSEEVEELKSENETLKRKWGEEKEKCMKLTSELNDAYKKENTNLTRRISHLERLVKNCSKCIKLV